MTYQKVRDALQDAGLDPDAAKELSPRSAFGRSCKEFKDQRTIDKLQAGAGGVMRFQFTKKHLEDGRLEFDYECVVTLNCETGDITCDESQEIEDHAKQLFAHAMQMRNAQDVTRLVQRLFQDNADLYPINPRKGVAYFVPEKHREFTQKVDDFLVSLGGCLSRFPVPKGTPQGNASVKEAVQSGLQHLMDELSSAVEDWDETTRKSTMEKAMERYQAIQYKVDAYNEYLGDMRDRLSERLDEARQELKRKIMELKPEPEEAAAA